MKFLIGLFVVLYILSAIDAVTPKRKIRRKKTASKIKSIPVIDMEKKTKQVKKILLENWEDYITYPAIKQIAEVDRLPLMQYIWKHWDIRIDFKKLYAKYPQYSQEILDRVEKVEAARFHMYLKHQEFWNEYMESNTKILITVMPVGGTGKQYYCLLQDMYNVFDYYIKDTEDYEFSHFPNYIAHWGHISEDKNIFFFANDKFIKLDKKTLLKLCKDVGIKNVS